MKEMGKVGSALGTIQVMNSKTKNSHIKWKEWKGREDRNGPQLPPVSEMCEYFIEETLHIFIRIN